MAPNPWRYAHEARAALAQLDATLATQGAAAAAHHFRRIRTASWAYVPPEHWSRDLVRALLDPALGRKDGWYADGLDVVPAERLEPDTPALLAHYLAHPDGDVRCRLWQHLTPPSCWPETLRRDTWFLERCGVAAEEHRGGPPRGATPQPPLGLPPLTLADLGTTQLSLLLAPETEWRLVSLFVSALPRPVIDVGGLLASTDGMWPYPVSGWRRSLGVGRDDYDETEVPVTDTSGHMSPGDLLGALARRRDLSDAELRLLLTRGGPVALLFYEGEALLRAMAAAPEHLAETPPGVSTGEWVPLLLDRAGVSLTDPARVAALDRRTVAVLLRVLPRAPRLDLLGTLGAARPTAAGRRARSASGIRL